MRRAAYVGFTAALTGAGVVAAAVGGHAPASVAIGAGVAWIVQSFSFWVLAGGLESGRKIVRVWVAGMGARFGVGVALWGLAALAGAPTRALMISYGMALVAFLLMEAGWLAVTTADRKVHTT